MGGAFFWITVSWEFTVIIIRFIFRNQLCV